MIVRSFVPPNPTSWQTGNQRRNVSTAKDIEIVLWKSLSSALLHGEVFYANDISVAYRMTR